MGSIDSGTDYPDDPYIRQYGQPVYWQTIMQAIGCNDLRQFYIAIVRTVFDVASRQESHPSLTVRIESVTHLMDSPMEIVQSLLSKVGIFANRKSKFS